MSDITKRQETGGTRFKRYETYWGDGRHSVSYGITTKGFNQITYQDGPMYDYLTHKLNWKTCTHTRYDSQGLPPGGIVQNYPQLGGKTVDYCWVAPPEAPSYSLPSYPSDELISETVEKLTAQVDLNCEDAVMIYSGLLQALPLVGAALKGASLLNRAARRLKKSLKRRPFSTVVRECIQADFINRFVVQPTIADMQKFHHAAEYVANVVRTAYQRTDSATGTAIEASSTQYSKHTEERGMRVTPYNDPMWYAICDQELDVSCKYTIKALADIQYNLQAIDPIKLWATRTGMLRPFESAWDLVPFSFVIDYFTRAGDFITEASNAVTHQDALVGNLGRIRGVWQMVTRRSTQKLSVVGLQRKRGNIGSAYAMLGGSTAGKVEFTRYPVDWAYLMGNLLAPDRGLIHVNLTQKRLQTLAELIIQAKLRR